MSNHRLKGKKAEDVACSFLQRNGLSLIERNYHCRFGEIDLIMQDSDSLVFVEVRYRSSSTFGDGLESVDANKRRKLVFAANHYLQNTSFEQPSRFDVVALSPEQAPQWICNAFMDS